MLMTCFFPFRRHTFGHQTAGSQKTQTMVRELLLCALCGTEIKRLHTARVVHLSGRYVITAGAVEKSKAVTQAMQPQ